MTQHVIQRGNNRSDMFRSPSDYEVFLYALRDAALRFALDVHAYVLMTNHVHLMMTPGTPTSLARAMQAIGRYYVPHFNERYRRTGGLFEGRYRSLIVGDESYWFTCMRYIELNPLRAGLVEKPEGYRWSSYRAHAMGVTDLVLTDHHLYTRLGETRDARCRSWRAICAVPIPETELAEIRGSIQSGRLVRGLILPEPGATSAIGP
jgi:putative transposase